MIGILDYGLAKVVDLFIKYVITPAVNYNSPVSFVEETEELTGAILTIVPLSDPKVDYALLFPSLRFWLIASYFSRILVG